MSAADGLPAMDAAPPVDNATTTTTTRGSTSSPVRHHIRSGSAANAVGKSANSTPDPRRSNSLVPSSARQPTNAAHLRQHSGGRSAPVSSAASVTSSREASPIRPSLRSLSSPSTSRSPSRQRRSPSRGPTSHPSISSTANFLRNPADPDKPNLPPPSATPDQHDDSVTPTKSNMVGQPADTSLNWPASPRLRSPPPFSRTTSYPQPASKRSEQDANVANTSSKRDSYAVPEETASKPDGEQEDAQPWSAARTSLTRGPSGSTLETVQEATIPTISTTDLEDEEDAVAKKPVPAGPESGSESGGNKSSKLKGDDKRRIASANARPGDIISKRSFTSLSAARGKMAEASTRNMIVEAETVSSVPQVSLGGGTNDRGASGRTDSTGSIRMKASDETIRPKKEKKKTVRKPTTLPPGTVSSKADIFEAKVASAVDEADTSDSEETFVYESNPPDPHPTRQHRYHSRTPSATSMASQIDQHGGRSRPGLRDPTHSVTGKRSMKFSNNAYNTFDSDGVEQGNARNGARTNGHVRHHTGRHGRSGGHPSLLEQSPFIPNHPKSPRHFISNGNRRVSRNTYRLVGSPKKNGDTYGYDFDGEGADDEQTPLVGSVRLNRNRHGRRPNSASLRQMEYVEQRQRGCFSRYGFCVLLLSLIFLLVGGATTFIIGLSKPLTNVYVKQISNVLASEQEIMLDLDVRATNPNLFTLSINDMDVNIFARSRFVGGDSFYRDHGPHPDPSLPRRKDSRARALMARIARQNASDPAVLLVRAADGIDKGTDPIFEDDPDPAGDPQTMLLGRIFNFDSPLTFDSSPWTHEPSRSLGEVRLAKPGNKTEEGGTERWERVLQHPFELIVRGVLKYQLPLSSRWRTASINGRVEVRPDKDAEGGDDDDGHGGDSDHGGDGEPDDGGKKHGDDHDDDDTAGINF